jgi:hypothetical protein
MAVKKPALRGLFVLCGKPDNKSWRHALHPWPGRRGDRWSQRRDPRVDRRFRHMIGEGLNDDRWNRRRCRWRALRSAATGHPDLQAILHGIAQFGPAIISKSGAWHRAPEVQAFSIGNQFLISSRISPIRISAISRPFIGLFAVFILPNRPSVAIGWPARGRLVTVQPSQLTTTRPYHEKDLSRSRHLPDRPGHLECLCPARPLHGRHRRRDL